MIIARWKLFRELNIHQHMDNLLENILSSNRSHEFSLLTKMNRTTGFPAVEAQEADTAIMPKVEMLGDNDIPVAIHSQLIEALNSMLAAALALKAEAKQISWNLTLVDFDQKLINITDLMVQIKQAHRKSEGIASRALQENLDEIVAELEACFDLILERMRVSRISKRKGLPTEERLNHV